jgi:hypothetical protein
MSRTPLLCNILYNVMRRVWAELCLPVWRCNNSSRPGGGWLATCGQLRIAVCHEKQIAVSAHANQDDRLFKARSHVGVTHCWQARLQLSTVFHLTTYTPLRLAVSLLAVASIVFQPCVIKVEALVGRPPHVCRALIPLQHGVVVGRLAVALVRGQAPTAVVVL